MREIKYSPVEKEHQAKFHHLEESLGIPVWKDLLALPSLQETHQPQIFRWEQKLKFTYAFRKEGREDETLVFVSEKTNLLTLLQLVPFLFSTYKFYACPYRLIQERLQLLKNGRGLSENNEVTAVLRRIMEAAVSKRGSDIHFENLKEGIRVRIRIDGKLSPLVMEKPIEENLLVKIKLISGMDIAQKRVPQDGHFQYINDHGIKYELRTSTIPGIYGEKLVVRILPATSTGLNLDTMGFARIQVKALRSAVHNRMGLILITGPTGSGKTTTLYALLRELMTDELNVLTIEDPVEYRLDQITQVEVNELAGVTFSSALRSFLRQDPDVILVGEIRDSETAKIVVRAAQTGHLVLSTLHCKNVFEAVTRFKSLGINGEDIGASLKLLTSQRLLRKRCVCEGGKADCLECNGCGIKGRIPVSEVLPITKNMKNLLSKNALISDLENQAKKENYQSLRHNGEALVDKNIIFANELHEVL